MSDPYRDSPASDPLDAPRDGGIVGDVIAQFADPNAFYRELVQNSIDAGSPDVEIELVYDESAERMRVSVRDKGEGMTREIVENQLLVLFRSTKEKDRTKIGKFGVGFASVLAPNPDVVIVNTARDGARLTLHLYRDLAYELFDAGRATSAGTSVEVVVPVSRDAAAAFERASLAALEKWCRHASVPIRVSVQRAGKVRDIRIDRPLAIENAVVHVKRTFDDGALTIVAGVVPGESPYLGFFNHGLTLHETSTGFGDRRVGVKIQDARLGHTISRDDVRRDDAYRHAVERAREVVARDLVAEATARVTELATTQPDRAYCDLVQALATAKVPPLEWTFPLVDPLPGGETTVAQPALPNPVWTSANSTPLTASLAASGIPVVRSYRREAIADALATFRRIARDVSLELTAVVPVESTDADDAILALTTELLDHVHRKPTRVCFVELVGLRTDLLATALPDLDTRVLTRDEAGRSPFALLGRRALALSIAHPYVEAARESEDPMLAAGHLVRAILLQYGLLDGARSDALTIRLLDRMGVKA